MAAASCLLSEDQFLCSICLEVFTAPVSTPCGHNFCNNCINQHWDNSIRYKCPYCDEDFKTRPKLRVNTFISEISAQFREELTNPARKTESRMCVKHDKPLELFCRDDEVSVCVLCTYSDHKAHDVVPLRDEYEGRKTVAKVQKRQLKIQELKQSVELSNKDADKEIADGVQVFTSLRECVEKTLNNLIKAVKEKRSATEKQAKGLIKELEQEISALTSRGSELQQLSGSMKQTLYVAAQPAGDWTKVNNRPPTYGGSVVRALALLDEMLNLQMKKAFEAELTRVRKYKVKVTLDPDDVHYSYATSGETNHAGKSSSKQERISKCKCVLANVAFTSYKHYFEVQVERHSTWTVGLARELNVSREVTLNPADGYFIARKKNKLEYYAAADPSVRLLLKSQPEKVGVFVDCEEGLVSFYDVSAAAPIYTFTGCSFTQRLHPFFSACENNGIKLHTSPDSSCVLQ